MEGSAVITRSSDVESPQTNSFHTRVAVGRASSFGSAPQTRRQGPLWTSVSLSRGAEALSQPLPSPPRPLTGLWSQASKPTPRVGEKQLDWSRGSGKEEFRLRLSDLRKKAPGT